MPEPAQPPTTSPKRGAAPGAKRSASLQERRLNKQRHYEMAGLYDANAVRGVEIETQSSGLAEGYASLFEEFTQHNDWNLRGCFDRVLAERRDKLRANAFHNREGLPLHIYDISVDQKGLRVVTKVPDHEGKNSALWASIRDGDLDGISIEFDWFKSVYRWMEEDEYEVENLGTPDDWWFPPFEYSQVWLRGYGHVLHPSADNARVEAVRCAMRSMDRLQVPGWRPEPEATPEPSTPTPSTAAPQRALDLSGPLGKLRDFNNDSVFKGALNKLRSL